MKELGPRPELIKKGFIYEGGIHHTYSMPAEEFVKKVNQQELEWEKQRGMDHRTEGIEDG